MILCSLAIDKDYIQLLLLTNLFENEFIKRDVEARDEPDTLPDVLETETFQNNVSRLRDRDFMSPFNVCHFNVL